MIEPTDGELVALAVGGDASAFEALYTRHRLYVKAGVRTRLRDLEDLDDVLQVTWMKVFRALRHFDGRATFRSWVLRIAFNHLIDQSRPRRKTCELTGLNLGDLAWSVDHRSAKQIILSIDVARAREALARVPHGQYLWQVAYLGVPYQELADREGLTLGALKSRLHRARVCVRQELGVAA